MANSDLKKLLDASLKPLVEAQEQFQQDLNGVKEDLQGVKEDLQGVKRDQAELRKTVEEQILPPLIYIETTVKSYADRYVTNEDHIGRLDKRLGVAEKKLGIKPPEELTIPRFD